MWRFVHGGAWLCCKSQCVLLWWAWAGGTGAGWGARSSVMLWALAAHDMVACGLSLQEDTERTQINVLAVRAITSLVLSAMTVPVAGNPAVSCLEQQPRNKPLKALDTRFAEWPHVSRVQLWRGL